MKNIDAKRLRTVFILLPFLVWAAGGGPARAAGRDKDTKSKDDAGWNISDSAGDDGFEEEDSGGEALTHFKDDSDDTYEDDADSSRDQIDSKFKEDQDKEDVDADSADEQQNEDR